MGEHSVSLLFFFFFFAGARERCPWCSFSGGPKACLIKCIYMFI